jgi:PAS domain-containing protein
MRSVPLQSVSKLGFSPKYRNQQLQATLNLIPAHAWYALPNGQLTFLNERAADYLGLPTDHPLRLGTGGAVDWESHILFLCLDDREETRRARSDRLSTGGAGDVSFSRA